MYRLVSILLGMTLLTGAVRSALADPPGTRLNAEQIRTQLVDHSSYGRVNGLAFVQYVASDGTQKIRMTNFSDSGTWRITADGHFCRTWKASTGGKEECVTVYQDGDTFYSVTSAGAVRANYTVKPGNPDRL